MRKYLAIGGCLIIVLGTAGAAAARDYEVAAQDLVVRLSADGRIVSATVGRQGLVRPLQVYTQLEGCDPVGPAVIRRRWSGGVTVVRKLVHTATKNECRLTERFLPGKTSVRWEVEIAAGGEAWSTPVETHLEWPVDPGATPAKFWLAQGGERGLLPPLHFVGHDRGGRVLTWSDPLQLQPFRDLRLAYGGREMLPGFSIPLVTVVEKQNDLGLTLALSPENVPATVSFQSQANGHLTFARKNLRLAKQWVVRLEMDLVAHAGDWRPALGWMVQRYPEYFNPPNPGAAQVAGCGAFCSSYAGELDAAQLRAMGARVNWGYGFTFPYIGMYLPYVPEGQEWVSYEGRKESSRSLDNLAKKWKAAGIHTLAEFVTTEWGYKTLAGRRIPTPDARAGDVKASSFRDGDAWQDATAFLTNKLPGAVLFGQSGQPVFSQLDLPYANVVVDPGEPVFAEFLIDQARRFVQEVPHCSGLCIDRMDWLELNNPRRDDGVTWVDGKPVRSLRVSWLEITQRLGAVLHPAGKSIFVNPHIKRLDLMRHVDGIFDEFGYLPFNNNATAFLGLRKPVMAWTPGEDFLRPDPDAFFQRYLYLGIYPMAPFPENATPVAWLHAIQPGAWAEQQYRDYGPLLDLNQGKQWVLEAHAVNVQGDLAKANIFAVPGGFVIPVVFGGQRDRVTVVLRRFPGLPRQPLCEARHPGAGTAVPVAIADDGSVLRLAVPLVRGCAMVRIHSGSERERAP